MSYRQEEVVAKRKTIAAQAKAAASVTPAATLFSGPAPLTRTWPFVKCSSAFVPHIACAASLTGGFPGRTCKRMHSQSFHEDSEDQAGSSACSYTGQKQSPQRPVYILTPKPLMVCWSSEPTLFWATAVLPCASWVVKLSFYSITPWSVQEDLLQPRRQDSFL